MHLWLLFLAATAAYSTSRISEPGLEAVNFAAEVRGRKLTGNVIQEMAVDSKNDCSFACVEEEKCRSYNFGKTKNTCQLSDSDRFVGAVNFTEDENFTYVGIQASSFRLNLNISILFASNTTHFTSSHGVLLHVISIGLMQVFPQRKFLNA